MKRCCWISASEFPSWLWGNHDYLDAWFLFLLFPSPPCSEYPSTSVLLSVKGQTLRQSAEWEQAGSHEFPVLHPLLGHTLHSSAT